MFSLKQSINYAESALGVKILSTFYLLPAIRTLWYFSPIKQFHFSNNMLEYMYIYMRIYMRVMLKGLTNYEISIKFRKVEFNL